MAENLVDHLLSQLPMPISLFSKQLHSVATGVFQFTLPFIAAIVRPSGSSEASSSSVSPELLNAAILLFILWLSLQIMGMASRYMYSMVMTMIKITMIFVFVIVTISIYNRGLMATQHDLKEFLETVALNEQWGKMKHDYSGISGQGPW